MELQVNRWGNSLAVRLPAQLARQLQVEEGSVIQAQAVGKGRLKLAGAKPVNRKAFLQRLKQLHERMPVSPPVVEDMRKDARY